MHFAEAEAQKRGYHAIRLDVFLENPVALSLYESLGYRHAGTVRLKKGPFACFEKPIHTVEGFAQQHSSGIGIAVQDQAPPSV